MSSYTYVNVNYNVGIQYHQHRNTDHDDFEKIKLPYFALWSRHTLCDSSSLLSHLSAVNPKVTDINIKPGKGTIRDNKGIN